MHSDMVEESRRLHVGFFALDSRGFAIEETKEEVCLYDVPRETMSIIDPVASSLGRFIPFCR